MRSEYSANLYLHTTRMQRARITLDSGGANYILLALVCVFVLAPMCAVLFMVAGGVVGCAVVAACLLLVMVCNGRR